MIRIVLTKVYSVIFGWFHDYFGINIRGLGFMLRSIDKDFIIHLQGGSFYFNYKVSACYTRLISCRFSEPETNSFLCYIVKEYKNKLSFVNIGANIGEMVFTMARLSQVENIFAVEPQSECLKVCAINNLLNGFSNVTLLPYVVSEKEGSVSFAVDGSPQSRIMNIESNSKSIVKLNATTIDILFSEIMTPFIMLIDVEGAELKVIKGGEKIISKNKPLIIFEYNSVTKDEFSLHDVQTVLGDDYKLFKLNKTGHLEMDLNNTWNIVAVSMTSDFYIICKHLLI